MDYKAIREKIEPYQNRELGKNKKEAVLSSLYFLADKYLRSATREEQNDTCIELKYAMSALNNLRGIKAHAEMLEKSKMGDKWDAIAKVRWESEQPNERAQFIDHEYEYAVKNKCNHYG